MTGFKIKGNCSRV